MEGKYEDAQEQHTCNCCCLFFTFAPGDSIKFLVNKLILNWTKMIKNPVKCKNKQSMESWMNGVDSHKFIDWNIILRAVGALSRTPSPYQNEEIICFGIPIIFQTNFRIYAIWIKLSYLGFYFNRKSTGSQIQKPCPIKNGNKYPH